MKSLPCLLPLLLLSGSDESTLLIGQAYVEEVLVKRDFEAAEFLTKQDMLWTDPTAHMMGSPLAKGVRGREQVTKLMRGFALEGVKMKPKYEFTSGPYYCFIGTFSVTSQASGAPTSFPFSTILKVEDDEVVERLDYGDYDVYIPETARIDGLKTDLDHPMVQSAKAYVDAYAKRDLARMAELRSEDVVFQDRTAVRIGSGSPVVGNAKVSSMLKGALGSLQAFSIDTDYLFFHGSYAFFAGQVSYSLPGASMGLGHELFSVTHPLAIVLQYQDGKIIRHDDLADYDSYARQLRAARAKRR